MAVFVHLADERDSRSILSSGIRVGKYRRGVYCLPVSASFTVTHQWLRELKRRGIRTIVATYFRLDGDQKVWWGKYYQGHKETTVSEAVEAYLAKEDQLGCEFLVPRKIEASEIIRLKKLPQTMGWRYNPQSHAEKRLSCGCPMCIARGEIKGAKKRKKFEDDYRRRDFYEIIEELQTCNSRLRQEELLWSLQGKRWKADPRLLQVVAKSEDAHLIELLCTVLTQFKHPNTMKMLKELGQSENALVQAAVAESVYEVDPANYRQLLAEVVDEGILEKVEYRV